MIIKKSKTALRVLREKGLGSVWSLLRHQLGLAKSVNEGVVIFDFFKSKNVIGTMADIGAHHGYELLPFASDGWIVFAFEPDPDNYVHLEELARKFNSVNIDVRAVSDQSALQIAFYKSVESDGISGLQAFLPSHKESYLVDVCTLREFVEERTIQTIDFLKIDTEGFDLMVLKGVPWENVKPRMILCEFEDAKTQPLGYSHQDMADYLIDKGYKVIVSEWKPIRRYGDKHDWHGFYPYPHTLHTAKAWGNLIAVRDDSDYQDLLTTLKA